MCIHSVDELKHAISHYQRRNRDQPVSGVILRGRRNYFEGSWLVDPTNSQEIANQVSDLKAWHGDGLHADLTMVNDWRRAHGLPELDAKGLPLPNRVPDPPIDEDSVEGLKGMEKAARFVDIWLERREGAAYA